jgi:hypothetical protein
MIDTIITAQQKKRILIWYIYCFILALLTNVFAILIFHTGWNEIFTQLHIVFGISVIYLILFLISRMIWKSIFRT